MNCERIDSQLIAYLDGKAGPAERRRVEAHLDACASCSLRAEQFRLVEGLLDELPVMAPSPAFDAAVRTRISAEPPRGFSAVFGWLVPSPRLVFAIAALMVFSIWLSTIRPVRAPAVAAAQQNSEAEFGMINNLPVLEDYDVLSDFDALSDLPVQPPTQQPAAAQQPNL